MKTPIATTTVARAAPFALVLAGAAAPQPSCAQADSVTVVAGAQYAAGDLHRFFLGRAYRNLWTTPIRVEVLDFGRFAGGLTLRGTGGGLQTRSLHLRGADGREYNFRPVDKDFTLALPEYAQETLVDRARQDQTSGQHPAAPLVATSLLDAVGVLNPGPRLVALPDDARLGRFREEFAGKLGTIEVHPNEGKDGERLFADAVEVDGSDDMLKEVEASSRDRVDAPAFLRARLMDVYLGDLDRHKDQWRWARYDSAGIRRWVPVPEDRDYAFINYDGLLPGIARATFLPRAVRFREEYASLGPMLANSEEFTRRLLAGLPRAAWDSAAAELQAGLTDREIERAVSTMPSEYRAVQGARLARILRGRRDRLPEMARHFYLLIANTPIVHATDEADRAVVERAPDGSVTVLLYAAAEVSPEPYYRRRFVPEETEEIRIFLHGGDDVARVTGQTERSIPVRVVGGGGDDLLEDRSRGRTYFYDDRGSNRFITGPRTTVDRRDYEPPKRKIGLLPAPPPRDWGHRFSLAPWAEWVPFAGPTIGIGPQWTRFGFRRYPYAERYRLRTEYAPLKGRFSLEVGGAFVREGSPDRLEVVARASSMDAVRFNGFGNDTREADDGNVVWLNRLSLDPRWNFFLAPGLRLAVGPRAVYTEPDDPDAGSPLLRERPRGTSGATQAGGWAGAWLDTRDDVNFPRRGFRAYAEAAGYPVGNDGEAFGSLSGVVSTYLSLPGTAPVLALRAGGKAVMGDFPFFEAAYLGGSSTLRGFRYGRYAGDALLHGSAELRVPLTTMEIVLRGRLGVSLLADVGRVYFDGESPGGWHSALGASAWFATPLATAHLTYASGEVGRFYLGLGMPF